MTGDSGSEIRVGNNLNLQACLCENMQCINEVTLGVSWFYGRMDFGISRTGSEVLKGADNGSGLDRG